MVKNEPHCISSRREGSRQHRSPSRRMKILLMKSQRPH